MCATSLDGGHHRPLRGQRSEYHRHEDDSRHPELSQQHYAEHVEKPFYPSLESFITSAPVVAMAIEGLEVITVVREMLGATSGLKAAAGTIRGDYSSSRQMNLVHASDSEESAERELELYFDSSELCDYEPVASEFLKAGDES